MKLTRKSYNRRVFAFGAVMFLAIALISTGFATWIMSNDATHNEDGTIEVGTITDGSIKFSDVKFTSEHESFYFEPDVNDQDGDVQFNSGKDGNSKSENLTVTIAGTVTPLSYLDRITIKMDELPAGIQAAVAKGYIELPECHNNEVELTSVNATLKEDAAADKISFEYDISFAWGDFFENINPSVYLDTRTKVFEGESEARKFKFEEKRATLIDFRRTMYQLGSEYSDEQVMTYNPDTAISYKVTLTAYANI